MGGGRTGIQKQKSEELEEVEESEVREIEK